MTDSKDLYPLLERIASALEKLSPQQESAPDLSQADAYVWQTEPDVLEAVEDVNRVDFDLLKGIDRQRESLLNNTLRFVEGYPANNALLWGARGTGKSSIVKAVHDKVNSLAEENNFNKVTLVEIHREDIPSLPRLLKILKTSERPCILFCDDLSFDTQDDTYKSLKAVLEGGIEGRPKNVLFYATSNRRHLMARDMIENERSSAIHTSEATEENVSLSDRFGLWLGFHNCDQDTFFAMIEGYVEKYGIKIDRDALHAEAREWSVTRGSRSGRVAWQFIQDLAGRMSIKIP
ncbi:ATP-binding protein [uncultured Kiloniella sp.]|uniref:ATP-binding protein n=1 Tax=uncultured Kiloniella sp. TaxID=1133091 RepID=UPI002623A672|nr:ATP-binding protein [uncultured Kiloniella sp.]